MKNRFTHRMTFTYLFALSIIALLSIASFFTLRKVISTQKTSASVINVTNRQRFLTQNVAIYALCLANAKNAAEIETSKQDLITTIIEMEQAHKGLIYGDPSLKLQGKQSPQVRAFYFKKPVQLEKKMHNYFSEAKKLSKEPVDNLSPYNAHVSNILNTFAQDLIVSLDMVINQLQSESEADNRKRQLLEFSVLCVTLFTLIIVAWYIFRPMVEKIEQEGQNLLRSEERTRLIIDNATNGIVTLSQDGIIKSFNPAAEKMFGYHRAEMHEKHVETILSKPYLNSLNDLLKDTTRRDKAGHLLLTVIEADGLRKDGDVVPTELTISEFYQEGQLIYLMIVRDVTEQRRAQRRTNVQYAVTRVLAESPSIAEAIPILLQSLGETLGYNVGIYWDRDDKNSGLCYKGTWHNYSPANDSEELLSCLTAIPPEKGLPGIVSTTKTPMGIPDIKDEPNGCHSPIALKYNLRGAVAFPVISEKEIPGVFEFFSVHKQPVDAYLLDCLNTLGNHIGQFFKRKETEEQIAHLATHDTLTNLFNRRRFNEELANWLVQSSRYNAHGALLFIDLDNFKHVNDTYGHQTGDELLVNVATTLKQRLRKSDVLARLGGDEFAVLLYHINDEQAVNIAKEMVETVLQIGKYTKNHYTNVTASIGIALFPDHSKELDGLIACADQAMYRAKECGRNCFCMYRGNA